MQTTGNHLLAELLRRRSSAVLEAFEEWCGEEEVSEPTTVDAKTFLGAYLGSTLGDASRPQLELLIAGIVDALPRQLSAERELEKLRVVCRELREQVDALKFKRPVGRPTKTNFLLKQLAQGTKQRGRPRALDIDPSLLRAEVDAQIASGQSQTRKAVLDDVADFLLRWEGKHSAGSRKSKLIRQLQRLDSSARPRSEKPSKIG